MTVRATSLFESRQGVKDIAVTLKNPSLDGLDIFVVSKATAEFVRATEGTSQQWKSIMK